MICIYHFKTLIIVKNKSPEIDYYVTIKGVPKTFGDLSPVDQNLLSDIAINICKRIEGYTCKFHSKAYKRVVVSYDDGEIRTSFYSCCTAFMQSLEKQFETFEYKIDGVPLRHLDQRTWN